MAKIKKIFVCTECGYECHKWMGQCPDCKAWNTLIEELKTDEPLKGTLTVTLAISPTVSSIDDIMASEEIRYMVGVEEIDRVLGGGIVPGSVILVSGDPGIGKSTILLQICNPLCQKLRVLYVSGEESTRQIKLRANRLGVSSQNLLILSNTSLDQVIAAIYDHKPDLVIIDSIQTMNATNITSAPGSISQTKECTARLIAAAKEREIPMFIVGHVNKDGAIAGPKVMEHMVDAVLYFEGERNMPYRILRAIKNRYGSTNEIGVFEMTDKGLSQVLNPSMMLLSGRPANVSGTAVTCVMEGTRPLLAEIQALVSKSSYPVPKRSANGVDFNRTAMLLAVLEKRCGYFMSNLDAYINVVGGLRLDEPAADLAVAVAIVSNLTGKVIGEHTAVFGEIGLTGEVRTVGHAALRISEAYRLGFRQIILPAQNVSAVNIDTMPGLELIGIKSLNELKRVLD